MEELLIRNGLIITETGRIEADIRIAGEHISEIGSNLSPSSEDIKEIDATGKTVLPGAIDPHVHLSNPPSVPAEKRWADNFESGSKAAIAGGITTLGCMSVPELRETPLETLERETKAIHNTAIADFMVHPVVFRPVKETINDLAKLVEQGCNTIKIFMVTDDYDEKEDLYKQVVQTAGENGILTMIHCEDNEIIKQTTERMMKEGRGSLLHYAESRPISAETVAVQKAVNITKQTGAPMYIVHLSSEEALAICEKAQQAGLPVHVEGRPIFLNLNEEMYQKSEGALYVVQPPLRKQVDVDALWRGVQKGSINTIATDHAPHTKGRKLNPDLDISKLVPGINELQVMLPMLYSNGVHGGKITLERFTEITSTFTAKLFGLYPQKGTISVGSDADLVIWDFEEERVIRDEDMFSQAGFSVYDGQSYTGWPQIVLRRGEIVFENRKIIGEPGTGRVIPRKPM